MIAGRDSHLGLAADLLATKALVWVASVGRDAELTVDAHRFFADRYARLARLHRARGWRRRADRLEQKALEHLREAGDDGPPFAAAMALPRPRSFIVTDAISRSSIRSPDDAA